jgi:hypothetical protein
VLIATVNARTIPQHAIRDDAKRIIVLILLSEVYELKSGSHASRTHSIQERIATCVPAPLLGADEHVSFPPREFRTEDLDFFDLVS